MPTYTPQSKKHILFFLGATDHLIDMKETLKHLGWLGGPSPKLFYKQWDLSFKY